MGRSKTSMYVAQAGVCCYCERPMLVVGDMSMKRFGEIYGLTRRQTQQRVATIEHLKRRADGGSNRSENLALACNICNSKRQDKPWVLYKSERMQNVIPPELRA